jgi:hypothetical protein
MWLSVMDNSNNAMKLTAYKCRSFGKEMAVQPAAMTDINKTYLFLRPSLFLFFLLLLFSFHSPIFINLYTTQGLLDKGS